MTEPATISAGQHFCWAVGHPVESEQLTVDWVRDGLRTGERMLYLEPASRDGELASLLDRNRIAWRGAAGSGQLVVATPEDALLIDGAFDLERLLASHAALVDQSIDAGYPAVRMLGAAVDLLTVVPGREALRTYEARIDGFCAARPVSILCLYDRRLFEDDLALFLRAHARAVADSQLRALVEPDRVRLVGEVDLVNVDLLSSLLDALPHGDVVVDMEGVSFIDLKGTAELVGFARRLGGQGRVTVLSPPPHLQRIVDTLGWVDELDLVAREGVA